MESKLILALVSAIFGWAIKAAWDVYGVRSRWRRLAPLVLRQLAAAAKMAVHSFDAVVLPRVEARLAAAQLSATELVAAGVHTKEWLDGLLLIADCLDAVQAAGAATIELRSEALGALRAKAKSLEEWGSRMQERQGRMLRP